MADQQALNATFFALRKREQSGVLTGTTLGFFVSLILMLAVFAVAVWGLLGSDFFAWYGEMVRAAANGATPSEPPNIGRVLLIVPLEFVLLFAVFVLLAAFESSCLRWMIRGERSGPFNLCFGADMWRVYGTYWAWLLYVVLGWLAFFVVALLAGMVAGAVGGKGGFIGPLIAAIIALGYLLVWLHATVRLAPAGATSIGLGEFAPLKAWTVTRGRFWALFGSYLLLVVINIVTACLLFALFFGAIYGAAFSQLDWASLGTDPEGFAQSYSRANMAMLQDMFSNPLMIALYFGGQLAINAVSLLFYVLYYGVSARAVQAALEEDKITRAA